MLPEETQIPNFGWCNLPQNLRVAPGLIDDGLESVIENAAAIEEM